MVRIPESKSLLIALICWVGLASHVSAQVQTDVNLEWRLEPGPPLMVNDTVRIGLYAVSSDGISNEPISSMSVVFAWDPAFLQFVGIDNTGLPCNWLSSFLPAFCPNEAIPPTDGDGLYLALGPFPPNICESTPAGLLVTTFMFTALAPTCGTDVYILPSACSPPTDTTVISGKVPGLEIQRQLGTISVAIVDPPCPVILGDMNCDDVLNGEDITGFAQALTDPGEYTINFPGCEINRADMDGSGTIDMADVPLFTAALLQP